MTYTKGGLLNTTQLESISGKKWKKGGILSADQLNELSNGSDEGNAFETIEVYSGYNSSITINGLKGRPKAFALILSESLNTTSNKEVVSMYDIPDYFRSVTAVTASSKGSLETDNFQYEYDNGSITLTCGSYTFRARHYVFFYVY